MRPPWVQLNYENDNPVRDDSYIAFDSYSTTCSEFYRLFRKVGITWTLDPDKKATEDMAAFLTTAPQVFFTSMYQTVAHKLISEACPPSLVKLALLREPRQAQIAVCYKHKSLAQEAVAVNVPLTILETIVQLDPTSCYRRDAFGRTLLHTAAKHAHSLAVFDFVLRSRPTAALVQDVTDCRPVNTDRAEYGRGRYPPYVDDPDLAQQIRQRLQYQERVDGALLRERTGAIIPRFPRRQEPELWDNILSFLPVSNRDTMFLNLTLSRGMEITLCTEYQHLPTQPSARLREILFLPLPSPFCHQFPFGFVDKHNCDCHMCSSRRGNWKGYPLPPTDLENNLYRTLNLPQKGFLMLEELNQRDSLYEVDDAIAEVAEGRATAISAPIRQALRKLDHNLFAKEQSHGLPIGHRVLHAGLPADVISDILVNPFSVQILGPAGDTMLPCAFKCRAPLDILQQIYRRYPRSALRLDANGLSVVHHAAQRRHSWAALRRAMAWEPLLCLLSDSTGRLPHMMEPIQYIDWTFGEPRPNRIPYPAFNEELVPVHEWVTPEQGIHRLSRYAHQLAAAILHKRFPRPPIDADTGKPIHEEHLLLKAISLAIGRMIIEQPLPSSIDIFPFFFTNRDVMLMCYRATPSFNGFGFSLHMAQSQLWYLSHYSESWFSIARPQTRRPHHQQYVPLSVPEDADRMYDWNDPYTPLLPQRPPDEEMPQQHHAEY